METQEMKSTNAGLPWYAIAGIAAMIYDAATGFNDGVRDAAAEAAA